MIGERDSLFFLDAEEMRTYINEHAFISDEERKRREIMQISNGGQSENKSTGRRGFGNNR